MLSGSIRAAISADLASIAAMARECFGPSAWSDAMLADCLGDRVHIILVAEAAPGSAIGYAVGLVAADELDVQSLAVDPRHRRRQWGAELLAALIEAGRRRGAHKAFLEVRDSNAGARRFYERHGFIECGIRTGYYHDPIEPAILMSRRLG